LVVVLSPECQSKAWRRRDENETHARRSDRKQAEGLILFNTWFMNDCGASRDLADSHQCLKDIFRSDPCRDGKREQSSPQVDLMRDLALEITVTIRYHDTTA
jgi:hypothetical protein